MSLNISLTHLVSTVTRPISGTCLNPLFLSHPERTTSTATAEIGLSDYMPVFATRIYKQRSLAEDSKQRHIYINHRDMKHFDNQIFSEICRAVTLRFGFYL